MVAAAVMLPSGMRPPLRTEPFCADPVHYSLIFPVESFRWPTHLAIHRAAHMLFVSSIFCVSAARPFYG